jgi:hypothetical protein
METVVSSPRETKAAHVLRTKRHKEQVISHMASLLVSTAHADPAWVLMDGFPSSADRKDKGMSPPAVAAAAAAAQANDHGSGSWQRPARSLGHRSGGLALGSEAAATPLVMESDR